MTFIAREAKGRRYSRRQLLTRAGRLGMAGLAGSMLGVGRALAGAGRLAGDPAHELAREAVAEAAGAARAATGIVGIAPGRRYFTDGRGEPFLVIGQNDAITWPPLDQLLAGHDAAAERYLDELQAAGVNTTRMMVEYAQFSVGLLEDPVGTYNPSVIEFWDRFLPMAARRGIRVLLTPWDPFWMEKNWDWNPWNRRNGGPLRSLRDFLTTEEGRLAQKRRWQFIIERWGDSPAIFGWELLNEVELWFGGSPSDIEAWIAELADFVRQVERARWGTSRLITCSTAAAFPDGKLGQVVFGHPSLDFATTHLYTGAIGDPHNAAEPALETAMAVAYALEAMPSPRPYLDTESGPINRWIDDPVFDALYYHHMSWAHLAAGGAGQGLRWPYRNPHVLTPEMRAVQRAMARFFESSQGLVDWRRFSPRPLGSEVEIEPPAGFPPSGPGILRGIEWVGSADPEAGVALVWVMDAVHAGPDDARRESPVIEGARVTVDAEVISRHAPPLRPTAIAWNTWTGMPVGSLPCRLGSGGKHLVVDLPSFSRDLLLVVRAGPADEGTKH